MRWLSFGRANRLYGIFLGAQIDRQLLRYFLKTRLCIVLCWVDPVCVLQVCIVSGHEELWKRGAGDGQEVRLGFATDNVCTLVAV